MSNKIVKFNAIILLLMVILFTVESQIINSYKVYLIYILQLICIIYNVITNKEKKVNYIKIILSIIIFFVFTLIIDFFAEYTSETIITTIIVFTNIILLSIMIGTVEKKLDNEIYIKFCKYFFIFVIIICLYAIIIRYFGGIPTYYDASEDGSIQYRQSVNIFGINFSQIVIPDRNISLGYGVASITGNPNTLSYLILFAEIIYLFFLERKDTKIKKVLYIAILTMTILMANSRLAVLLYMMMLIIRIFFISKLKTSADKKYSLMKISIGVALMIISFLILNMGKINIWEQIDFNGRNDMWNVALEEIKNNPLKMNGLGASGEILKIKLGKEISMHNTYLDFALNYGIFILFVFIIYNILLIVNSIRNLLASTNEKDIRRILVQIIFLIVLLIIGLSEGTVMTFSIYNLLYFYNILNLRIINKGGSISER